MVTIGDVLGVVAFLVGLGGTAWALTVACGLLFPDRVERCRAAVDLSAKACVGRGAVVLLPGILGFVLLTVPLPGLKLVGWGLLLAVLALGAIGMAGLSAFAGARLQRMAPEMTDYASFLRGAGFLVGASMFPLLGWFAFGPIALLAALGAGWQGARARLVPPVIEAR